MKYVHIKFHLNTFIQPFRVCDFSVRVVSVVPAFFHQFKIKFRTKAIDESRFVCEFEWLVNETHCSYTHKHTHSLLQTQSLTVRME